jgi:hypothetical protein
MEIYPHEAWCPRCRVSHPPGTKRCLHCGNAVLPVRPVEGMRSSTPTPMTPGPIYVPSSFPELPRDAGDADDATKPAMGKLRLGMNVLWVLLFVVVTAVRVCSERG